MRFLFAVVIAALVSFPGIALVEALHVESFGYFLVLLVAMFAGSLADRERFYGIQPHK